MAPRRTAAGMLEVGKGLRRIQAHEQLPVLDQVLLDHRSRPQLDRTGDAA